MVKSKKKKSLIELIKPLSYQINDAWLRMYVAIEKEHRKRKELMEEELISFDTAVLAKKKGFKARGYHLIDIEKKTKETLLYELPPQSLLQKWLRENHKRYVRPVFSPLHWTYYVDCMDGNLFAKEHTCYIGTKKHDTYEQALETGLFDTLKLIK